MDVEVQGAQEVLGVAEDRADSEGREDTTDEASQGRLAHLGRRESLESQARLVNLENKAFRDPLDLQEELGK